MTDTFLDWAGEAEYAAIAEMCARLFGVGRAFVMSNKGPGRIRVRGYAEDGARIDIPLRLIHEDDVVVTIIGGTT